METTTSLNDSGIALTEADRPDEAILLFRKAIAIEPENPLLWLNLGIALQKKGDYKEALDSFQKAIYIENSLSEAWGAMGLIYYEWELLALAEQCYNSGLERKSDSPKIWNNLGVLHFSQKNYEEARNCFEEAIHLAPLYYDAIYNLRDTCRELEDYRATAEFERILSGIPKYKNVKQTGYQIHQGSL